MGTMTDDIPDGRSPLRKPTTRPPYDKAGIPMSWCAWHEDWEVTIACSWCGTRMPSCYGGAHLRYACVEYDRPTVPA